MTMLNGVSRADKDTIEFKVGSATMGVTPAVTGECCSSGTATVIQSAAV